MPLPLGPEDAHDLAVGHLEVDGVDRGEVAVGDGEVGDRRASGAHLRSCRPCRRGSARCRGWPSAVNAMRITLAAIAPPKLSGPGLAEQPVHERPGASGWSGRTMNTVAPNSPSEIANANPAATSAARATIGRSTSRQTRARRRAERRRGVAQARIDGAQHRCHHPHDERYRDQRLRDRDQPPRAAQVERRVVERDEEPEADGDRGDAEGERHQRVEAAAPRRRERERRAPADDHRDQRWPPPRTGASWRSRAPAPRTACCPRAPRRARGRSRVRARSACRTSGRRARRAARRAAPPSAPRLAATNARAPGVRGRRSRLRSRRAGESVTRCRPSIQLVERGGAARWRRAARPSARRRAAGSGTARSGGRSRSRAWRVPGPPRIRITPNDVKVKRNTIAAAAAIAGRSDGRVTSRNARHRLAPSMRAASSGRGSRCAQRLPTVRTTTA